MNEDLFQAGYDVTKKSKLKRFYDSYKIFIDSSVFILIIIFVSFSFYIGSKEKKRILLSENYVQAKIYLESGNKNEAKNILKETIFENDPTYSTLSLFLIVNENMIQDNSELIELFDHVLKNNKLSEEIKNLLIYKKALFNSDFIDEYKLIESTRTLINSDNLWKPHALLLLGDYFAFKGENIKSIEFYQEIFTINNLHPNIYDHAKSQLSKISNE